MASETRVGWRWMGELRACHVLFDWMRDRALEQEQLAPVERRWTLEGQRPADWGKSGAVSPRNHLITIGEHTLHQNMLSTRDTLSMPLSPRAGLGRRAAEAATAAPAVTAAEADAGAQQGPAPVAVTTGILDAGEDPRSEKVPRTPSIQASKSQTQSYFHVL